MKIYAFLNKTEFKSSDILRLQHLGANIYFNKDIAEVEELFESSEDKILILQWTGLKTNGHAELETVLKVQNLKGVCLSTTGYGWVDYQGLRDHGIDLCNCPGKSSSSVAEFYYFMTIALLRKMPLYIQNSCNALEGVVGKEVSGLKVGIVGMGDIGKYYANICNSNNMKVSYWNRSEVQSKFEKLELEELFIKSDVILISLSGNNDTNKLLNKGHINSMKKDSIILNCAESSLIDSDLIIQKVEAGELGGFGFESFTTKTQNHTSNIYISPEIAYYTENALENESRVMTDTAISYLEGECINLVN